MPNQPKRQHVNPERVTLPEGVTPAVHRELCPLWCQGYHLISEHDEDQVHESECFVIEMGMPKGDGSDDGRDGSGDQGVEPADVSIYAARWPGSPTTWLVLSYGAEHLFRVRVDYGGRAGAFERVLEFVRLGAGAYAAADPTARRAYNQAVALNVRDDSGSGVVVTDDGARRSRSWMPSLPW